MVNNTIMKQIFFLLFMLVGVIAGAQTPTINSTRFGNLKLDAPVDSISKYLGQKIVFSNTEADLFEQDTLFTSYKGVQVRLVFDHRITEGIQSSHLYSIYTESTDVATKSGIRAGQHKFDVIRKLDGSHLYMRPEPELGKNISIVVLDDMDNATQVCFYFRDNILYAIEISMVEEGC